MIGVFSSRCGLLQSIYKWHVKIICNLPFAATSSLEIRILQRPGEYSMMCLFFRRKMPVVLCQLPAFVRAP
jgi:hypothetical protein